MLSNKIKKKKSAFVLYTVSIFGLLVFHFTIFFGFRGYLISEHNREAEQNRTITNELIHKSVEFLISQKVAFYNNQADLCFSNPQVLSPLEQHDRNSFQNSVQYYFDRIKEIDQQFWGLHVILPDNHSFIRMHKPTTPDKYIPIGKKPLIDYVNTVKKRAIGFDDGKFGFFLRIVIPIFSKGNKYLGVAEYSVNTELLTEYIKSELGYDVLFLVKNINQKKFLKDLPQTSDGYSIFKSTNSTLFQYYDSNFTDNALKVKEELGSIATIPYELSENAKLIVAVDINRLRMNERHFVRNVTILMCIIMIVLTILWIAVTVLWAKHQKQVTTMLDDFMNIISKNIIYTTTDLNGIIQSVSEAFCKITGFSKSEVIGTQYKLLDCNSILKKHKDVCDAVSHCNCWSGEVFNRTKEGGKYWTQTTISPSYNSHNKKIGYTSISHDITDKKHVEKLSVTDGMTSLFNRRYFDQLFPNILNQVKRNREILVFIMLDVDYFKQYNDTYGHHLGDKVLIAIAKSLQESFKRASDYCFRLGGEEFGVIASVSEKSHGEILAEKVRKCIVDLQIEHSGNKVHTFATVSIGLWCQQVDMLDSCDHIYQETDKLLYIAKKTGRNKVVSN